MEEKLNGAAYQVDSELDKKANQLNKTTKAILKLAASESDSPHLLEPILTDSTLPTLEELEEPSGSNNKEKFIKW